MKSKKSPERFCIRFDSAIPEHQQVIEILSRKGRNASRYIADAIIAYETKNTNPIENTITEVVTKILAMNNLNNDASVQDDISEDTFDFAEISADLEAFKQ